MEQKSAIVQINNFNGDQTVKDVIGIGVGKCVVVMRDILGIGAIKKDFI